MKTIRAIFLSLMMTCTMIPFTLSQLNQVEFLMGGVNDAEVLFQEYLGPYANVFGANLNAGWYNTGKPHKLGGFDVTITMNASWVPSADKLFNLNDLELSDDASFTGGPESPTVAGAKTDARPEIAYSKNIPGVGNIEYASFKLPNGTGLSIIPMPMIQAGIGLPFGTDLSVRLLPSIDLGNVGNIGLWGVGLKHSIIQHIPVLKKLPVLDITAQGGYSRFSTYANVNYAPDDIPAVEIDYVNDPNVWLDQKLELVASAWTANLVVSETLPVISFYQAIGYSSSTVNLGLTGNFPFPSIEADGDVVVNNVQGEGIIKDPIDIEMNNHKNIRLNAGMRIKLGVLTIHFDYTKAYYSVATAGIGISFR